MQVKFILMSADFAKNYKSLFLLYKKRNISTITGFHNALAHILLAKYLISNGRLTINMP